jgi:hypothetical protein
MIPLFATSTIPDSNMSLRFDEAAQVIQNREKFLAKHKITWEQHVCMRCNHGDTIRVVNTRTKTDTNRMLDAEVLITQESDFALALLTADCLPALFFDNVTHTLALAHFSRHTIANELPKKVVVFLKKNFGVLAEDIQVSVGPHVHRKSYAFPLPQPSLPQTIDTYVERTDTNVYVDLPAAHSAQLIAAGIKEKNLHYSNVDTVTSPNYFSHHQATRKGGRSGRIMTISMM